MTSVHDLAHAKGVPSAAREAMLLMQERIAELEAVADMYAREILIQRDQLAALSGKEQTDGE